MPASESGGQLERLGYSEDYNDYNDYEDVFISGPEMEGPATTSQSRTSKPPSAGTPSVSAAAEVSRSGSTQGSVGSGAQGTPEVLLRSMENFVATPLFVTVDSAEGLAAVNFTAPDNLGTFVVRVYAVTGGASFFCFLVATTPCTTMYQWVVQSVFKPRFYFEVQR